MGEQELGEGVQLFMRVGDDGEEVLVGVARDMDSVPDLLCAIADHWQDSAAKRRLDLFDRLILMADAEANDRSYENRP